VGFNCGSDGGSVKEWTVAFGWSDERLYTYQIRGWQFGDPSRARLVSQQPSRKKPVMGLSEQICSGSPRTLRAGFRPPPLPESSLSITGLCLSFYTMNCLGKG
jgi:hypothetical protein